MDGHWLEHFATAIGVIAAVNFGYIITHFPKEIVNNLLQFDANQNDKINKYTDKKLPKVAESIRALTSRNTCGAKIDHLIEELTNRLKHIENYSKISNDLLQKKSLWLKRAKGIKCLFLVGSLYCVFVLFLIGLLSCPHFGISHKLLITINICTLSVLIWLSFMVVFNRWAKCDDSYCYQTTIKALVLVFIICLLIHLWFIDSEIANQLYKYISPYENHILFTSVCIPLYPCVFSLLIVAAVLSWGCILRFIYGIVIFHLQLWKLKYKKREIDKALHTLKGNFNWR